MIKYNTEVVFNFKYMYINKEIKLIVCFAPFIRQKLLTIKLKEGNDITTLSKAIDLYIMTLQKESYATSTIEKYRNDLYLFKKYLTDYISIDEIDSGIIIKYLCFLFNVKNLTLSTIRYKRQVLKGFFQFLLKEEIIKIDPYSMLCKKQLTTLIKEESIRRNIN